MDQLTSSDPTHIGPYRLIARLGAGGMGLVYLGRSAAGRTVAVKVVQAEYAQHPEFRSRFAREVSAARRVGGAWTADVLDADTDAEVPWVATQYIPGPDLSTVVNKDFGPLPEHSVLVLANRLALALQAVHEAGLIHRDLKPSNVLVTVDGPRVIDFGIARAMDSVTGDSLHTRTGMLVGSPGFMSPEQVRGRDLTPANDVFCLGAVLVFAATGRLLFGATDTGLNAHLFRIAEEEADLTGVPEPLLDLVGRCLDKDPAGRPAPQEVAAGTEADTDGEWLPGKVLAQLGRHAARLLDYAPRTAVGAPGTAVGAREADVGQPGTAGGEAETVAGASAAASAQAPTRPADPRVRAGQAGAPTRVPAPTAHLYFPQGTTVPWSAASAAWVPPHGSPFTRPRRWWALAVVAFVQLLVLFDAASLSTIWLLVRYDLGSHLADFNRMYLGYDVAFGGLLLIGGHVADLVGRRRVLLIGVAGLAVAAAIGGTAATSGMLILAYILQGAFAGLLSPAALALVSADFSERKARGTAFGVYAAVGVGGPTLGGIATMGLAYSLDWRVCLYAGVLLALIAVIGVATVGHDHPARTRPRPDLPGLLLGSGGIGLLAYALGASSASDWSGLAVLLLSAVGVALLLAFAWWQTKAVTPLLPPYVVKDRTRVGSLVTLLLSGVGAAVIGSTLTLYLGYFRHYSPFSAAETMLPTVVAVAIGAVLVSGRMLHRVSPLKLIVSGLILTALGLFLLSLLLPAGVPTGLILPGKLLTGLGLGMAFMPLFSLAMDGITTEDSGGGAAVTTIAFEGGWLLGGALSSATLVVNRLDSYAETLEWAAGITLLAVLAAALLFRSSGRRVPGSLG